MPVGRCCDALVATVIAPIRLHGAHARRHRANAGRPSISMLRLMDVQIHVADGPALGGSMAGE